MNSPLFSDESRRFAGATIYIVLAPDNSYKFGSGKSVPLSICVTHQRTRRYIATGHKVASIKEYEALISKSAVAIETSKELRKFFERVCTKTDELILLNRFSVADLKTYLDKSEGKVLQKNYSRPTTGRL